MKKLSFIFIAMLVASYSHAAFDMNKVYYGGGLSSNSAANASGGTGFQFFGGYPLPVKVPKGKLAVEVGYMDTGDMTTPDVNFGFITIPGIDLSASGLWGNAVYTMPLQKNLDLIGRAGLDLGDDDGFMYGVGVGYKFNPKMELRGEYVLRGYTDSLQVNFVMKM